MRWLLGVTAGDYRPLRRRGWPLHLPGRAGKPADRAHARGHGALLPASARSERCV